MSDARYGLLLGLLAPMWSLVLAFISWILRSFESAWDRLKSCDICFIESPWFLTFCQFFDWKIWRRWFLWSSQSSKVNFFLEIQNLFNLHTTLFWLFRDFSILWVNGSKLFDSKCNKFDHKDCWIKSYLSKFMLKFVGIIQNCFF